jgi:hypothetical protein
LALSFNLKSALKDGIEDQDIEVKVDKTVVFINLSDKCYTKVVALMYLQGQTKF